MDIDFLGVGWTSPVQLDEKGQIKVARYEDSVRQSIWMILGTAKGERVMRPDFGAGLNALQFEPLSTTTMALAQEPDGENWDYLVRSLNVLEDQAADEVVKALKSVRVATDDPMAIRQLILLGVRAETKGKPFENVEALLEHWTGMMAGKKGTRRDEVYKDFLWAILNSSEFCSNH